MKNAWIENGAVRDLCDGNPALLFTAEIAAHFGTPVPDGTLQGATLVSGTWVNPTPPPAPPAPPPPPDPAQWLIDIGPFFDRFGASKMAILTSTDVVVQAIVQDVTVRKWVDLQRADVGQAIDVLIAKAVPGINAAMKTAVLTTPVTHAENLAVRKLYFS